MVAQAITPLITEPSSDVLPHSVSITTHPAQALGKNQSVDEILHMLVPKKIKPVNDRLEPSFFVKDSKSEQSNLSDLENSARSFKELEESAGNISVTRDRGITQVGDADLRDETHLKETPNSHIYSNPRTKHPPPEELSHPPKDKPRKNLESLDEGNTLVCSHDVQRESAFFLPDPKLIDDSTVTNTDIASEDIRDFRTVPCNQENSCFKINQQALKANQVKTKHVSDWQIKEGKENYLNKYLNQDENSQNLTQGNKRIYLNQDLTDTADCPHRHELRDLPLNQDKLAGDAPPLPTRVPNHSTGSENLPAPSSALSEQNQRKEMYDIKKIKWCDQQPRGTAKMSPILVQNVNGPCPLLALVNVLILSTPPGINTPLIETLRSREQVSLGLLLDAVFDEITSGRHGNITNELLDVTDLYSFLITLHTGMNVNPIFFPIKSRVEQSTSKEKAKHVGEIVGSFEETREMRLYNTFQISLIHGWLPKPDSPEYSALFRCAKTYEDAQNVILMQESLESKLCNEGLNIEEQVLLEDISTIKAFFDTHATQLTPYGLSSIRSSMVPGNFAIFFRNNHFSTLYRHPRTLELLQLVTDIGYAKNDEATWESLTDVTGEHTQFFSGDFKLISEPPATSAYKKSSECCDLVNQLENQSATLDLSTEDQGILPQTLKMQQEDHDLALALQLQEEEEQRNSAGVNRRRAAEVPEQEIRENQSDIERVRDISRFTATNVPNTRAEINGPIIPPRRSVMSVRSHPDLQATNIEVEADTPPPSYEVAATQKAYVPSDISVSNPSHRIYNPHTASRVEENTRNEDTSRRNQRMQEPRDPMLISRSEMRIGRRMRPAQAVMDKVISGQERVQKECIIM